MTRINTNVPSLVAQNRLQRSNNSLQTALTRLSTGLKINTGADDPAGLIASEALRSEITSANKAISNTRRANQIIATADSALAQVSSLLNDVRGLVVEAANTGALSDDEIAANQLQIDSSLEAINRIAQTTTFQGRKLLDGSLDFITQGGNNFGKISNLNIDQANLGATGSINVNVEITTKATKAKIDIDNIATGTTGTGTINLGNVSPNGEAETQALSTGAGGAYTVSAKNGGIYDGTAGNAVQVNIVSGDTTATAHAATATQTTADGGDFSISAKATGAFKGANGNAVTLNVVSGNTATAQAVSAAQDVNGVTGAFTIRAKAGGAFDGVAGNAVTVTIESANALAADAVATVTGNALAIEVDDATSLSLDDIKAALEADANFQDDFEFIINDGSEAVLFRNDGSDDIATAFDLDGETAGTDAAATVDLTGSVLTITVDDNSVRTLSEIQTAVEALATFSADFEFNLGVDGDFEDDGSDDINAATFTGGDNKDAEATLASNVLTITVSDEGPITLNAIKAALATEVAFNAFEFNVDTNANFAANGSDDVEDELLGSGTPGTNATLTDAISITAPAGNNRNGSITIATSAAVTTAAPTTAVDENGNITVTVNNTGNTALSAIVNSINTTLGNSGYEAELTTNNGDAIYNPTTDVFTTSPIAGSSAGGLAADVVFELSGNSGSEVFNVNAGTTIDQLVAQINLVTDATGITATSDGGTLSLESSTFGSKAIVDIKVISEGAGGNFTPEVASGARATGTDVVAKVNGVDANVDGTKISVNTATLDLALEIESDFLGTSSFSITGGGALFQLGPDVVSNQQARIGLTSVGTARLGGTTGRLFELGSGESAALATDAGRASEIVNEAITRVTSLRGRLGAFQRTTLDSNLSSLTDTVANLLEAESSIRDADFAQESANLTRSQILVQSGTNVLSLANQNPQNVLSLLR